jgi:RNA polymerase sigma-70 factor (ECF subfamily)
MSDRSSDGAAASRSLAALLESRYAEFRRFALRKSGSATMADDVMQDAWLRLADPRGRSMEIGAVQNPASYLRRIIANLVIDRQRQMTAQARHVTQGEAPVDIGSDAPSAFQVLAGRQELATLREAIGELPEKCREVFLLYRGDDMTMQQVADRLGVSPRTVENHLARAMVHCRKRLRDVGRDA